MERDHLTVLSAMREGWPATVAVLGMVTGLPLTTVRATLEQLTARGQVEPKDLGFATAWRLRTVH